VSVEKRSRTILKRRMLEVSGKANADSKYDCRSSKIAQGQEDRCECLKGLLKRAYKSKLLVRQESHMQPTSSQPSIVQRIGQLYDSAVQMG
jgi:hypothetical protein